MKPSTLVVFGTAQNLPTTRFDTVIAPAALRDQFAEATQFIELESCIDVGSIEEAAAFSEELSRAELPDGRRVAKLVEYEGHDLWWIHYDDLYYKFCIPYVQYQTLLTRLAESGSVTLVHPPAPLLFRYFLEAKGIDHRIIGNDGEVRLSFSVWLQTALSIPFLLILMILRPRLMVWTSDFFDLHRDHDFRVRYIYEELRRTRTAFVEFIRSQETWQTVLAHAWTRKRAVIYTNAITSVLRSVAHLLVGGQDERNIATSEPFRSTDDAFRARIATHYLRNASGDIWAIQVIRLMLRLIGVKAAIITTANARNFHEVLACKGAGIKTVGIQHGLASRAYNIYDFMPGFDGTTSIGLDRYGMWSSWWKEYYLTHSRIYGAEQLAVVGPMRPLPKKEVAPHAQNDGPLRVLFVSEQLGVPEETLPYLEALLDAPDLSVSMKFRAYKDGFEAWLRAHRPDILERIGEDHMLRGSMDDAVQASDIVVGSHSTGVLEALLRTKPCIFFRSKKWGDHFDLATFESPYTFMTDTPAAFLDAVRTSRDIPLETLEALRERYFGDPYENGSAWVVKEAKRYLAS